MRASRTVWAAAVLVFLAPLVGCVSDQLRVDLGPITFDPSLFTVTYQIVDQYMNPIAFQSVTACYDNAECQTVFTDLAGLASFPRLPGVDICLRELANHVTIDGKHFDRADNNETLCLPPVPSNATRTAISLRPPDFDTISDSVSVAATGIGTNDWLVESIEFSWPGYDLWGELTVDSPIRIRVSFNCGDALRDEVSGSLHMKGSDWIIENELVVTAASASKVVLAGIETPSGNAYCEAPIGSVLVTRMSVGWDYHNRFVDSATPRTIATGVSGREP